jgi:hypothetical protein
MRRSKDRRQPRLSRVVLVLGLGAVGFLWMADPGRTPPGVNLINSGGRMFLRHYYYRRCTGYAEYLTHRRQFKMSRVRVQDRRRRGETDPVRWSAAEDTWRSSVGTRTSAVGTRAIRFG